MWPSWMSDTSYQSKAIHVCPATILNCEAGALIRSRYSFPLNIFSLLLAIILTKRIHLLAGATTVLVPSFKTMTGAANSTSYPVVLLLYSTVRLDSKIPAFRFGNPVVTGEINTSRGLIALEEKNKYVLSIDAVLAAFHVPKPLLPRRVLIDRVLRFFGCYVVISTRTSHDASYAVFRLFSFVYCAENK